MIQDVPLISCICVTSRRIRLLKQAIEYFESQSYPNKELVVSYPKSDSLTKHILNKLVLQKSINLKAVERPDNLSLGSARNHAIVNSEGEYICTWDDDDWYHPERLQLQKSFLTDAGPDIQACVLNQIILFDGETKTAYLSFIYPWENTLLFHKNAFGEFQYSNKDKGEDSHIMDSLHAQHRLCFIGGAASLYIYIYHRENTWGRAHFKSFISRSTILEAEFNKYLAQLIAVSEQI